MTQPRVAGTADAGATLARPHVWAPGDEGWTGPALLLLHGTGGNERAVSYTHLTLPTICSV